MALKAAKSADWLDHRRVRGYAVLVGLASLALLVDAYLKAIGPVGSDFLAFWGAGQVTATGHPAQAYDLAVQQRVQTATGHAGWFAFVNPPPFLFLAAPLGWLSYPAAWLAWVALGYALWAFVSIKAFPRLWPLVLVFPGALIAATHAQTGFVTGALLVGGVMLVARGRPVAGGALLGALVIKPHLALLVPFWLLADGRWRAIGAALLSAVGLVALAWLTFGTATMLAYPSSWSASATLMRGTDPGFYLRMVTVYGQLRLVVGPATAITLQGLLSLAMAALVMASRWRFSGDAWASGALTLAATPLASPYLFNYDLPFLILPLLWLVSRGLDAGFRPWEKAALVLLYFAPFATRAAALPLHLNLMPVASAALVWLVWSRGVSDASGQRSATEEG